MKPVIVKGYLTEALLQLLRDKPLNEISINELVRKAGVCRSSFYRNYLTPEQIIDEYLENIFMENGRNHPIDPEDMKGSIAQQFGTLLPEKEHLLTLSRRNLLLRMPQYIYNGTVSEITRFGVMNNRYQPHYFAGAASAMIAAWIGYGMEESPEEMAELFVKSLYGYMEFK